MELEQDNRWPTWHFELFAMIEVLAFGSRSFLQELFVLFVLLAGLYLLVKLFDKSGLGYPRGPYWRFIGPHVSNRRRRKRRRHRHRQRDDPFEVLKIEPTDDLDEINAAYIELAKQTHPDLHPDDLQAKEKFQRIQRAYSQVGDQSALYMYLTDHPLEEAAHGSSWVTAREVVELDVFKRERTAYRATWRMKQMSASQDVKYLQGPNSSRPPRRTSFTSWLSRDRRRSETQEIVVDRVVFLAPDDEQGLDVPHLQIYGKLLRVGTQDELHAVIAYLLTSNAMPFVDRFHPGGMVSFHGIGKRLGHNAALSPTGTYPEFVTNLAKLGLYRGADVRKIS